MISKTNLEASWRVHLQSEFSKTYMQKLKLFLSTEYKNKKTIYPKKNELFNAFYLTPFDKVKVVIIGQDPYHGPDQAHGLSFSVKPGIKIPPSLRNMYKELQSDLGIAPAEHGNLQTWAEQGVLLLNATLTVEAGSAGSHQKKGWEEFTDLVIRTLNDKRENLVFVLWGAYAQKKGAIIDGSKHCILKSVHPSPLSAHRGFFGSRPYSKTNKFLVSKSLQPINWSL